MIALIRIKGDVGLESRMRETLERLRLRRKYACVVIQPNKNSLGSVKKVSDFVAYGEISDEMLQKLIEKRGKLIDKNKKVDPKKVAEDFKKGKKLEELNIKPFFRLHPPRKGIESKKHFGIGKGVLGNNKEKINDLLERML